MTKPLLVSLARRFAYMAALLAGIAMLAIAGASWWLINQEHAASLRSLLKKDAELQATSISSKLHTIDTRMSELANSSLIANALVDSADKERFLIPYLKGIQHIHDIPVAMLFTDFEGREIAGNGNGSFNEQELNWLREKLPAGQPAARVQLGEKGEELIAVEFIFLSRSNSAEGALLYRIKLDELRLQTGVRLVRGKESEQLLHSQAAMAAAVDVPPIYKHLDFAVLTSPDPSARSLHWQRLLIFFILTVGMVVTVIMLGLHFGKRLTRDLLSLEFFARSVSEKGLDTGRAEVGDSLEIASLAQSINGMLEHLKQQHDKLNESEERFHSVFEYSKVGMCVQDDGRYLDVNPAFVEMTGYSKEELLRRSVGDITHPDEVESGTALRNTLLTGAIDHFHREKRYIRKDGSILWAHVTLSVGRDDAGKPLAVIGIIQDITERKRAQDEILRLNASLEERVQELHSQEEELRQSNEELEEKNKLSQTLTEELHSQQEELRQSNEELEEKNKLLADQKVEVEYKNREIEASKLTLEEKAEQLALTSKYKSEFLSNMSHELRTPLNSLLILSQLLAENAEHNLSEQQIEYAKTIQGAGKDLLALINDILDLSKIESGTVTLDLQDVSLANVREPMERAFRHVAQSRSLGFSVELAPSLPPSLYTDSQRLQQVLKNLLSNAFKFTEKGQVSVRIAAVESGWSVDHAGLNRAQAVIGFFVTDSGIGLATTKQKIIFEAFQQADTGIARKYGGTGLGLSISREIAWLLGGELHLVESEPGKGSTFVLYLPLRAPEPGQELLGSDTNGTTLSAFAMTNVTVIASEARQSTMDRHGLRPRDDETGLLGSDPKNSPEANPQPPAALDDRAAIKPGDRTLLIIEDDARFAGILLRAARDKGFKGIVAARGDAGLELAGEFKPTAITLDLHLPDMDGWVVLERLKHNPDTRHIPVEIISAEDNRPRGLRYGALEYLVKPVTAEALQKALADVKKFSEREVKDLLVADSDEQHRNNVLDLIGNGDVRIKAVASGKDALAALKKKRYDCIVLDLKLPDISVADLLEAIQGFDLTRDVPVIVYGMDELPQQEQERRQRRRAHQSGGQPKSLALKGIVKKVWTPERLLDETALFLHRVVSKLPEERRQMLEKLYLRADSLAGKKVLVVDDDVRNIFALTAVLERHKMAVLSAENGSKALEELVQNPDVDIVLMDIMMPEMDGYEAMRQIRQMKQFESLPMIAFTAKAMKGDREKCIAAGASDYLSKPVDTDQLVSLLRVWLYS